MLYLDVGWVTRLQDESRDDGHGLRPSPAAHVRDPEAYRRFCELNALLFEPLPAQLKEEALIDYIGSLLLDPVAESGAMPDWVADLAGYLRCNCEKNWPIAALSERVALSRYHLIRVFRQNTGLTPHAYQIDCRINLARQMLRAGCDLSDLALQLGFSDQSHFQRAFLQRTSITPGDYQRQMRR
jgi:AraC-like DNA-binding protein